MTKHVFILGIILLAIFTGGGAKTPVNPEEPPDTSWHTWEIPSRSNVIRYISNIMNMKCPDTLIGGASNSTHGDTRQIFRRIN